MYNRKMEMEKNMENAMEPGIYVGVIGIRNCHMGVDAPLAASRL